MKWGVGGGWGWVGLWVGGWMGIGAGSGWLLLQARLDLLVLESYSDNFDGYD